MNGKRYLLPAFTLIAGFTAALVLSFIVKTQQVQFKNGTLLAYDDSPCCPHPPATRIKVEKDGRYYIGFTWQIESQYLSYHVRVIWIDKPDREMWAQTIPLEDTSLEGTQHLAHISIPSCIVDPTMTYRIEIEGIKGDERVTLRRFTIRFIPPGTAGY